MTRASGDGSLIAVVGIGCRLPGAADPEAFWRLLSEGRDAVGEVSSERLELAGYEADRSSLWEEDPAARFGAFLEAVDGFDPAFFEISPREAAAMDPQQRLALELGWEALEDAGIAAGKVRGGAVGVFLGSIASDYGALLDRHQPGAIDRHSVTGLNRGIIANRVSYALGLTGPSLTVDAAQSSSLVAVHLACESLRKDESEIALAGGIHLNIDPRGALKASRFGGLSPDGRCFTFDARANGYVRGEGGGIVVLKSLAQAKAAGDRVYCVIRGSAVNNDGGGESLTVPSQVAQESVLRRAYRRSGLKRSDVQYVELHGTGTAVGDPIEAAALGAVLGADRAGEAPLPVGSAKTNIGHLEGAAGIAGLIKAALAIERREIPASLNFETPNPRIPLDELGLRVQDGLGGWPFAERPLVAGVSSFGMGGTNCHVVLAEEPLEPKEAPDKSKKPDQTDRSSADQVASRPLAGPLPLVLSAGSEMALQAQAGKLVAHLEARPDLALADLAYSLGTTREALGTRAVVLGEDREQLLSGFADLASGAKGSRLVRGTARGERKVAFVFPGQGSQWQGMALELAADSPVFASHLAECEVALAPHIDFSVGDVLAGSPGAPSIERIEVLQPVLFAVLVSLAKEWLSCGVVPAAVAGHSQGEIAAAHVAGGLSLEDAAMLAAVRSRVISKLAGQGGLVSVALAGPPLESLLESLGGRLEVAAHNGPASTIVAGEGDALDQLLAHCMADDVRAREVPAAIASHSAFVEPLRDELLEALASISPLEGDVPFYSTVTGGLLDTRELGPDYWYRNLRETVRFEQVTRQLLADGQRALIEISPHPVFGVALEETIEDALGDPDAATVLPTLRRDEGGAERFAQSLAEAHVAGAALDWGALLAGAKRVTLPTYAFQRGRYWIDSQAPLTDLRPDSEPRQRDRPAPPPRESDPADLLDVVRTEMAVVLGHDVADEIDPTKAFKELGFDSVAAVELRNRLRETTGLRLPAAAVFNHPNATALAAFLHRQASGVDASESAAATRAVSSEESIAIVGMSCRYPGGIASPAELWRLVAEGRDAIGGFPLDRGWDLERLYDLDPEASATAYVREGGFLVDAADFDPAFFGISPREALATDPQQRLLLEASWEALEDAGIDPASLRETATGVFAGVGSQDYAASTGSRQEELDGYRLTGGLASVVSGRVAYVLGLEGPAITVDTACSSSLVTLHLASQALRTGECSLALAGGVTVLSTPTIFSEFARQRGLAPDGRSKSFAEAADGVGWSEGVGVLALECLSDAEANGHRVLATIRGSAVNQDGASNGLTAPNGPSQERVILQALANARLEPKDVDAVEAHGTGTTLGDPIEAGALLATYGQEREEPLKLGSIKSNIGHAQAAAGVAGVIKTVMAMREGMLPKTLHVDRPSSKVDWEAGQVELLTESAEWKANGHPRRAGVSSFGISGTNAHLILEEAPAPSAGEKAQGKGGPGASSGEAPLAGPIPLVISAKSPEALRESASRLAAHLKNNPELDLADLSFSLATTRAAMDERAAVVGEGRDQLLEALDALASDKPSADTHTATALSGRLAYLFTGQGSQRVGMGKELYGTFAVYREALDEACAEIDKHLDRSLEDLLFAEPGSKGAELLDHTTYTQPALFATEVALYRLCESFGLEPDLLTGHSVGEIVAAHVSQVLSLSDAAKLICARGMLMGKLPSGGAMLAIEATEQEARDSIGGKEELLSIAALNGPAAAVLSGEAKAIEALEAQWQERGRKTKLLAVSHASHSPLIEPMLEGFAKAIAEIDFQEPKTPIVSSTTGELLSKEQATDPAYWVSHVRQPVRFADAVATLKDQGATTYLELGPEAVLTAMAARCLGEDDRAELIPTLREGRDEARSLAFAFASTVAAGATPEWSTFFAGTGAMAVPLPTYPFQRERYWLDSTTDSGDVTAAGLSDPAHPMLAVAIEDPQRDGLILGGRISRRSHPWLSDHAVFGTVILPGTAFVELGLEAAAEVGAEAIVELTLQAPLVLSEEGAVQLRVAVAGADQNGEREINIHSRLDADDARGGEWTCHATGVLGSISTPAPESLGTWPPEGAEPVDLELVYERLAGQGYEYGPAFQGVRKAWRLGNEVFAEASLAEEETADAARFALHPALLDSAFHAGLDVTLDGAGETGKVGLPFTWHGVRADSGGQSSLRVRIVAEPDRFSLIGFDRSGQPTISIETLVMRGIDQGRLQAASRRKALYRVGWDEIAPRSRAAAGAPRLAILGEGDVAGLEAELYPDLPSLVDAGADAPPDIVVVAPTRSPSGQAGHSAAESAHAVARWGLETAQAWLEQESLRDARLVFLVEGALAVGEDDHSDPAVASLAGLLRSAQAEHPDRFALIDLDADGASADALADALELCAEEPQLALRGGRMLAARLVEADVDAAVDPALLDPDATVLITGGTGGIGALIARHLAEGGARHLLLASRRGPRAPGAEELAAELRELGCEAAIAACDAAERDQLGLLIESIAAEHPLAAVIHTAGVLDDGVLSALDPTRLRDVMRPKVDAAWNLHELTAGKDLAQFVMFSSAAGLLGGPSQTNYAAANGFLDGLAALRQQDGLPATSLAWGLWERASGMTAEMSEGELAEFRERVHGVLGFLPISSERGVELFDAGRSMGTALLAPVEFDLAALQARAEAGALPPILRGLVRAPARQRADGSPLAAKLASLPEAERERELLELVRAHVAAVLGHGSPQSIPAERVFKDLGFDSLAAVELRNRLSGATGVRLPPTLAFDHPSAAALAAFLGGQLEGGSRSVVVVQPRAAATEEPIAIVGMSCRFPGGVGSPEELWELLAEGRDAISDFPPDRGWDMERLYHPDPDHTGTSYAMEGGFIDDPADFDAAFFEVSPREALAIDPQQRVLLEACWEACEDAGLDPDQLQGSQTGVFAGVMYHDYGVAFPIAGELEGYMTRVSSGSIVAGRVSYSLGLEGPAMSVDTACSSSLVTLHLASQALRAGECSLALAGGVTVLSTPGIFIEFSRQRGLSRDGRCKSFAEGADGTGFGEGVGVLVLERLSEAEANGHHVLATIRGSAVNQDGASNGLTAPNGPSQERVIRQALANARLEPKDVDVVEAHGTGTTLGDPIEAGALLATYGQDRDTPLKLGSVKSNLGHTQAAAGVAGVIKTVMAMREGVLPKTLHVDEPSSKVDWEAGEIELLTEPFEWAPNGRPRRAGVSSFGASGTNAHLILEEAPGQSVVEEHGGKLLPGPIPLVFSAKSEEALRDSASRLASHLKENPELDLADLAFSLATTRAAMEERAAVIGEDPKELLAALEAIATGSPSPDTHIATALSGRLAYLFTGQGSQRAGMGKELYETYPAYREALDGACTEIDSHLDRPLKDLLFAEPGSKEAELLDNTTYAQPALFATEVALYRLLQSFGLKPDLLTGHSVGEIVAAHISGVLDLKDAAKLICARGKLMGALPEGGAMLAIEAAEQEAKESIEGKEELLSIAAINGPTAAVISGEAKAIEALDADWQAKDRKTKRLVVSHAFHSPLIEPMLEDFAAAIAEIDFQEPQIPIVSNTSGELLSKEQATDPAYWVAHVREPVRFTDAVATLKAQGTTTYLELGPEAVLTAMATSCLAEDDKAQLIPTLREGRDEIKSLALAFASTVAAGAKPEWSAFFEGTGAEAVPLPTYPFQRERYWINPTTLGSDPSAIGQIAVEHPFLAATIEDPGGDGLVLTGSISLQSHPWLGDHAVAGAVLLPATAFVEMALRAGGEVGCELIEELALQVPLVLPESGGVAIQVKVESPGERSEREISIHSRPETSEDERAEWTCHAQGVLSRHLSREVGSLGAWPPEGAEPIELDSVYDHLAELGFEYGPAFQGLSAAWALGEEIYAEVSLAPEQVAEAGSFALHPALLDSAFRTGLDALLVDASKPVLPFLWRGVQLDSAGASELRVRLGHSGEDVSMSLEAFDSSGAPRLAVGSVLAREVDPSGLQGVSAPSPLYGLRWQEAMERNAVEQGPVEVVELEQLGFERSPDLATTARAAIQSALEYLQGRLAGAEEEPERAVLLTVNAVAASEVEDPDPAGAAVWGLVRSAQAESPGAFALIDSDGSEASRRALPEAIALGAEEPQLALREGELLLPRIARLPVPARDEENGVALDADSTVLVTGATGGLGALVAHHLTEAHGVRQLLLVSRSGEEAEGAADLRAQLEELGASVRIEACDVSDRERLRSLIDSIDPEHPLGAIVHAAGVLDDGVLASLDAESLERVLAPKAEGAWHLHELSKDLDLSAFVLFSSIGGTLGGAGQANYAAANAFLDGLAHRRRAAGLPAISIGWGLWEGGMGSSLGSADLARLQRAGLAPLSDQQGLALFDATLASDRAHVLPVRFDVAALRGQAAAQGVPALLRALFRAPRRVRLDRGSLGERLAGMAEPERLDLVLDLVRTHTAAVLGRGSAAGVDPDRAFKELGFDSLAAVELRNGLGAASGIRLPATVVFDYPTARELARYLLSETSGSAGSRGSVVRAQASEEPIAIVGMSCRYPGGAGSPRELWELVAEGRDAIGSLPTDRGWNLERLYDPNPDNVGTSYAKEGGFLSDAADFDSAFFAMSPREALSTDPQQRLLLESSWEALEDAGIDPATLQGTSAGVFAGVMYQDYGAVEHGLAAGMSGSVVSGRVAYSLGLEGPAMTVDTACSSSLVALHLASQALRQGECGLALAGGVTVLSTPGVLAYMSQQRGLAPDGRSKSFAEAADGVGWSEGVGVLALERLSEAEANGHRVLATIRGSAVNQDGASNGLTAPNGPSQERVILQALANARLEPGDVDAVEAHGTGTTLGDPIEAGALIATYGQDREQPLKLGSIKSNIGHTQAAAGVAGVIKTVMAMQEAVLPKTLHVDQPSSKVDWEAGQIELLTEPAEWKPNGHPRRAGVSSFGASGTNAHLILEEAPERPAAKGRGGEARPLLGDTIPPIVLSAKAEPALRQSAARLAAHLGANPGLELNDLAYSLATTRSGFERRAAVVAGDREELLAGLAALARGGDAPNLIEGTATGEHRPAFLFPGHGAQWRGMAVELAESSPLFAAHMDACEEALEPLVEWSLREELRDEGGAWMDRLDVLQPALFATMVSLARLWQACGVEPAAVAGHSQGEISAAHIAGGLSLEDAARIVALRAKSLTRIAGKGAMASISVRQDELESLLDPFGERISLAAINGPASLVVSGDPESLEELIASCEDDGIRAKRIAANGAGHSAQVEPLEPELLDAFAPISPRSGEIPFYSTVTGEAIDTAELGPEYWYRNAREPVRFEPVVRSMLAGGQRTLIEIGTHPVLGFVVQEAIDEILRSGDEATVIGTLRRDEGGTARFALSLALAHAAGAEPDWNALFKGTGAKAVPLPTYPFQRRRFWLNPGGGGSDPSAIGLAAAGHPFLGASIEDPRGEGLILTGRVSLQSHPWLADHAAAETVLLPGTAFVEMALRAGREVGCDLLEELAIQAPLALSEAVGVSVQVRVEGPDGRGNREVSIHSRAEASEEREAWVCHAEGVLRAGAAEIEPLGLSWPPEGAEKIEADSVYRRLADVGFDYGPSFQALTAAWKLGDDVYAEVSLAGEQASEAGGFAVHPALFDAAFHAGLDQRLATGGKLMLPFLWRGIRFAGAGAPSLRVRLRVEGDSMSLDAFDSSGSPVLGAEEVVGREVDPASLQSAAGSLPLYRLRWQEAVGTAVGEDIPARLLELGELGFERSPDAAATARAATQSALEHVQGWLAEEAQEAERLVLLSEGAVAVSAEEDPDLAGAAVWGLIRSVNSEHPGRFAAIDSDGTEASRRALPEAIAIAGEEPQLALREGRLLVPRLHVAGQAHEGEPARPIEPSSTVLITGGLSGIGAAVARHLADAHGARHLLLVSRSGGEAPGAAELRAELERLGASVRIEACDVSDRAQVKALIDSIEPEHPLGAIVHSAGVLDDGVIEALDAERVERVMRPKADAAWHLHELSERLDLSQFLLFSSGAGLLGGAAQANYSAANAFLDALAAHRKARGLPATSLAWGLWGLGSAAIANEIAEEDRERAVEQVRVRLANAPISAEQGLELFDAARASDEPLAMPMRFDRSIMRSQAAAGTLPALLRGLISSSARPEDSRESLAERLAAMPESQHEGFVLDLVRGAAATVLGHGSAAEVEPDRPFKDLGFDSLAAVELRNGLGAATGVRLPATIVFDYPSARDLTAYLLGDADPVEPTPAVPEPDPEESEVLDQIDEMALEDLVERTLSRETADLDAGVAE